MSNTPRIAYVGPVPPIRGGIAQHGASLVSSLREQGARVDVWSWSRQYPALLYPGTERDEGPGVAGARHALRWWDPISWARVGRAARGADAIVFQWVTPVHALPLRTIRGVARIRSIAIVHNPLPHERHAGDRLLTRIGLGGIDEAVCHTDAVASEMRAMMPEGRVHVIAHPPNLTVEPMPPPERRSPLRLLMPGFIRPYKGFEDAIEAVGLARADGLDVVLTVAGDFWSPSADEAREAVMGRGLNGAVRLEPGYVSDKRLIELIQTHHAMLLPYREATQSGLIPISLSAGRPVITTSAGGLASQVRPGVDAIVCPPCDPTALAKAMSALADDYDRYATSTSAHQPSWDDLAAEVIGLVVS